MTRRWAVLAALTLAVMVAAVPALAGHGSWDHHHLHWFESGTSNYGSYADVSATNPYDYGHARWERYYAGTSSLIEAETVTCEGAETCGYRKTVTQYFPQSRYDLLSGACAEDSGHKLAGVDQLYSPCSSRALQTHKHSATTN